MSLPWLLLHTLKRLRTLLIPMGLLLTAFQIVLVLVGRSIAKTASFNQIGDMLPPFMREMMGPALASIMSFSGTVCVGYFHLAVFGSLVGLAISVGTIPASEIETGFMDLILARPIARHWLITRTIVVSAVSTAAMLVLMMTGTWTGLEWLAAQRTDWPTGHLIGTLAFNLWLLLMCWSSIALAIASVSRRRGTAGAIAGLLALTMFLLDYIGRIWNAADRYARLSPFRYYDAFDLVMGHPLRTKNVWVLCAVAASGWAVAYVGFARRDIVR